MNNDPEEREKQAMSSLEESEAPTSDLPSMEADAIQTDRLEPGDFQKLDPRAIKLWKIEVLPFVGITSLVALIGGSVLWIFISAPALLILLAWTALASLFLVLTLWLPSRKYYSWSYRANDQMLELRYGIFWHTSVMIPLSRLQHVDMSRGPFERHLGLATLEVHTAGTRAASHKIPGMKMETALVLRDQLVSAADLSIEDE
jgi:membrane protein YdbS with pleckstrin-like domain